MVKQYPTRIGLYTLREMLTNLELRDTPALCITWPTRKQGCIQRAHVSDEALLAVPGLADTLWKFERETSEWIPIFHFAGSLDELGAMLDIEPSTSRYDEPDALWITPKGFPRAQYHEVY